VGVQHSAARGEGAASVGTGREETAVARVLDSGVNGGKIPPSNCFDKNIGSRYSQTDVN
jgi:hypothetical protein